LQMCQHQHLDKIYQRVIAKVRDLSAVQSDLRTLQSLQVESFEARL
jgi:hypothetical protein